MTLVLAAAPAAAQRTWEIGAGYSYLQDPPDRVDFRGGWLAEGAVGLNGWLRAVGDVSRHWEATLDIHLSTVAFLGGVRASARVGHLTEFAQLLGGVVRSASTVVGVTSADSNPSVQPGAGVDYPLAARVSARAQFDYRLVRGGAGPPIADPRHQFRYSAAIVYHGWSR